MPTLALMRDHRSVRHYRAEPLDEAELREAVSAAQMASTSSHGQAYGLLRVRDDAKRARLMELCGGQAMVREAGAFFVVLGDLRRHWLIAEDAGREAVDNLETFLLAVVDASLFAQNLALALEARGYGICYIGGLRNRLREVDELLALPRGVLPLYGLCAGEPARREGRKPRLPLEAVLFDERYPDDERMRALVAEHDRVMAAYYEQRGAPGRDWSQGVARKVAQARREYLAAYYRDKGAVLD